MGILKLLPLLGVLITLMEPTTAQVINYFGVAFSPYVKSASVPWDSYTIDEIKQMLRIVVTKHNLISTYSMGVASYNNGRPWDACDSNAIVARAAAQINRESNSVVISVSIGIYQNDDAAVMSREIDNAFSAAIDANSIQGGTVWGLVFTNEFVTDGSNGPRVLAWIRANKARAQQNNLKVGARVHTCGEIWGGNNQGILEQIAAESDFIMCNFYPTSANANNPAGAVAQMNDAYFSARDGFWRTNPNLEVMIGETGWANEGQTFNGMVNNIENEKAFWEGMRTWAGNNRVKVHMFEAFDEPWKTGLEGEKHFGWWFRPNDNEDRYIEKATGRQ